MKVLNDNQILYRTIYVFSGSEFLGSFTAPNKQLPTANSPFKPFDHVSSSYIFIYISNI